MEVNKRDGSFEDFSLEKVNADLDDVYRWSEISPDLPTIPRPELLRLFLMKLPETSAAVQSRTIRGLLVNILTETMVRWPGNTFIAARLMLNGIEKNCREKFSEFVEETRDTWKGNFLAFVAKNADRLDGMEKKLDRGPMSYGALAAFLKSFLLIREGKVVEKLSHLFMRVAVVLHASSDDDRHFETSERILRRIERTYTNMALGYISPSSPTLMNAGRSPQQLASCFLLTLDDVSLRGMMKGLERVTKIMYENGGVGLSVTKVPAARNVKDGPTLFTWFKMLDVMIGASRLQQERRPCGVAIFVEPWHMDVLEIVSLKLQRGLEHEHTPNLNFGLWIPDLFMRRVRENGQWTLFCPSVASDLIDLMGEQFERAYLELETRDGLPESVRRVVRAADLWRSFLMTQIRTGEPYVMFKDTVNRLSNQLNEGIVRGSNLCCEIVQRSDGNENGVCVLSSICLPRFVRSVNEIENWKRTGPLLFSTDDAYFFDFDQLSTFVKRALANLNQILWRSEYPDAESSRGALRQRAVGLGVQGLADAFYRMGFAYEDVGARLLNRAIFETIYFSAASYSVGGSQQRNPLDGRQLHPDRFFQLYPEARALSEKIEGLKGVPTAKDWEKLRTKLAKKGSRYSFLVAVMPTVTTAALFDNIEGVDPPYSNVYVVNSFAGDLVKINLHLVRDLHALGLWSAEMYEQILVADGSIQKIEAIPERLRFIYKTPTELPWDTLIRLAADRQPFVDQSQSMNNYQDSPTIEEISRKLFLAHELGLKTGQYYLRVKTAASPAQFFSCGSLYATSAAVKVDNGGGNCGSLYATSAAVKAESHEDSNGGGDESTGERSQEQSGEESARKSTDDSGDSSGEDCWGHLNHNFH